jgi:flavin reductase (DIM6/NTAB) family NADH-FMN oxidoreductase RutF
MTGRHKAVTTLLPCPAVILTAAAGERSDAMAATAFFVAEVPPLLSVSVAEHHLTSELIEESGEFVVNVATPEQVEMVRKLGSTHGRDIDKFREFQVATEPSETVGAPRVSGAFACLECRVVSSHKAATYQVYTAEVSAFVVHEERTPLLWHLDRFFSMGAAAG